METRNPDSLGGTPVEELLQDNTPSDVLLLDRTPTILHYFRRMGPTVKLYAVPSEGKPIYTIYYDKDSNSLFLRSGTYSFQLTAKPQKAFQRELKLTSGTLKFLQIYESQIEAERIQLEQNKRFERFF